MAVDVVIQDARWAEAGLEALASRATDAALEHLGLVPDNWEVSVLGADDARIAALNGAFRGKAKATNVLSWPSAERRVPGGVPEMPGMGDDSELGDLALAFETCRAEAEAGGLTFADHVSHLIVHGVLHLLGYDHETAGDAARMEELEAAILATLGIADPY